MERIATEDATVQGVADVEDATAQGAVDTTAQDVTGVEDVQGVADVEATTAQGAVDTTVQDVADAMSSRARRRMRRAQLLILFILIVLLAVGGTATYAWFVSNNKVDTNSVSVHSGDDSLVVEMGDGTTWSSGETVSLATTSSQDGMILYPVSTYDLESFVECSEFDGDGQAVKFVQADDGVNFYHGYLYVRARFTGGVSHTGTVALYLSDSLKTTSDDSDLLKAARVGVKFSKVDSAEAGVVEGGVTEAAHYFELDSTPGSRQSEHPTTAPLALPSYQEGQLLGWANGALAAGDDKVEDSAVYMLSGFSLPEASLVKLELDTIYRLDVYYYIEGCDLDSANYLNKSGGLLHINLFATLA